MEQELQKLQKMFNCGRISRREFIAKLSALGIAATVAPSLISKATAASGPKKGGRLRVGISGGAVSESIDPGLIVGNMTMALSSTLRNNLVEIDTDFNAIPELAENWESSSDAKKWIFNLRKGVEFHNGKTMDAADVVFSINHHRKEDSKSGAKGFVKQIKDIKADGKHTVIFELQGGNADFPYVMAEYMLQIVPDGTSDFEKGIGTGGYILTEYEPGVNAMTKRNPNYWKKGRAHFDEVQFIGIAESNARVNALRTNQVDLINELDTKTFDLLAKVPGINCIETKGLMHYTFGMRADIPPFNNNDARLAMKYAMDRELVLKQVFRGHGELGNDHPVSSQNRFYDPNLEQRKFDPDKAKYYLKKAGLEGETFNLYVADVGFQGAVDTGTLYMEAASKHGINIKAVKVPDDGYWTETWGKKTWTPCWWGGRTTEDSVFSLGWAKGAAWDDTKWNNDKFQNLLVAARAELDTEKRKEMYWEMQKIARDEGTRVVFAFIPYLDATNDKVKHGKIGSSHILDGLYFAERWWFDA